MIGVEDIKLYLPQYLSELDTNTLIQNLKDFPSNIDERFYTQKLNDTPNLFQGDGVQKMTFCDVIQKQFIEDRPGILISNTCDMDLQNKRSLPLNLLYAPIINLEKYQCLCEANYDSKRAKNLIDAIKNQSTSSYFYLPKHISGLAYEGFISLDKIENVRNTTELNKYFIKNRLFSLSDYGFYILLFKLSFHFTRIQERVVGG